MICIEIVVFYVSVSGELPHFFSNAIAWRGPVESSQDVARRSLRHQPELEA